MKWPWSKKRGQNAAREELERALEETRRLIAQAYTGFNTAVDQELVESYIYEIQSLKARYSFLLRQRKALDAAPAPAGRRLRRRAAEPSALPVA